jgi:glycosyltransferase involved in cell wall biosynthesis
MNIKNNNKSYYIAEFCLPSKNAYSIHVLKMCDNIKGLKYNLNLIIPSCNAKFTHIKKDYNLKNRFRIISIFKRKNYINFLDRIIFSLWAAIIVKKNSPCFVITRSLLSSFFFSLLKKEHYLEIHGNIYGLTNFLLTKLNYINSKYIIKIIFITKNLAKYYKINKKKYIILPDGFERRDFKYPYKKINKISKFIYTGSFASGKGTDTIIKLAHLIPDKLFYLYGDKSYKNFNNIPSNVKIFSYVKYKYIPKILNTADALLMPYKNKVFYNKALSDDIGNFHSPLKMFEYLASGKILISSNRKVLKEILKNKVNCLIVKNNNINGWLKCIKYAENNLKKIHKITKYAKKEVQNYSWEKRIKSIISYSKE